MSFAELATQKQTTVATCVIGAIVTGLDDVEAAGLTSMLAADLKTWPNTGPGSIQQAFKDEGFEVGEKAIRAHRTEACRCVEVGQ